MMRILYHIALADFLERTRRYSFLITIGVIVYLAYLSFPPIDTDYQVIGLSDYRGVYNSAWVGSSIALLCSSLLSLAGFYLVKNAIQRDYLTGVGQIIATTPLSKWKYLIGKLISNTVFLMAMVIIISLGGIVMQLYRAESTHIELWSYWAPIIFTTLPVMALVSAMALLFESVKFLRGGLGNVLYYFVFIFALMASMGFENKDFANREYTDPFGLNIIIGSMQSEAYKNFPDYKGSFAIGGSDVKDHVQTFDWDGIEWTSEMVLWRVFWILAAIILTSLVTMFFKRFEDIYEKGIRRKKKQKVKDINEEEVNEEDFSSITLTEIPRYKTNWLSQLSRITVAELKLMLKGLNRWWYLVAVVIGFLGLVVPMKTAIILVPFTWVWPLLIWSKMGNRELIHRSNQYIFSSPSPVKSQLPAIWLAGFIIAFCAGYGWFLRLLFTGEFIALISWFTGALMVPSLALASGIWTNSSKFFEIVYFLMWYVGPMHQSSWLDFMGITRTGDITTSIYIISFSLLLIVLSVLGRKRQIHLV